MPPAGYATDWTAIVLAAVLATTAIGGMFAMSRLLSPRRPSATKAIPYESGIVPTQLGRSQFNVRYYIFAILFLIFDVEAVFLFPWAVVFLDSINAVFYEMLIFIGILFFGIIYSWKKGVLQWN